MTAKWADPGGSATGGTELLTSPGAGVTAQTSVTNGQAYAYKFDTGSPATTYRAKWAVGALVAAGDRLSVFTRLPALPAVNNGWFPVAVTPTGSNTSLLGVTIGSDGLLRLYTSLGTTLLKTGASVLTIDRWYRISLSYAITSTTNWSAKVYLDGVLEFTATNADGTLSSAAPADALSTVASTAGTSFVAYLSDLYADDTTDQSDPGNAHATRRAVTTVSAGAWDTTTGTGDLTERPVNTGNRIGQLATAQATVDYTIEAASAGDVDITGATILGRAVYAWFTLSSLTGTPTGTLRIDGGDIGSAMDPAVANTYQLAYVVDTGTAYPATVGVKSSGIAADTLVAELGAVVAYIPAVAQDTPELRGRPGGLRGQIQMQQLLAQ